MGDFGDNLRQEREARGVALEEISSATKISVRLLQAIEDEEFDRLPGGVFNVNFVRQYARHLGLDEEAVVDEFRRLTAPVPEQESTAAKPAAPYAGWSEASDSEYDWDRQRQSQMRMLATFVVLAIGVVAGLYLLVSSRRNAAQPVAVTSAAPAPEPAPSGAPAAPAPAAPAAEIPAEAKPAEAAPTPAGQAAPIAARPAALAPAAPAAATATSAEAPSVGVAGAEAAVRVEIRTNAMVWVSAVADGQVLFQRTLDPEETRVVTAKSAVRLRVGDAAALSVTLNGKPQPELGPKGQVRTVVLTPEGMRVLAPPPKPPETEGAAGGAQPGGHPQAATPQSSAPPNP